MPFVFNPLSGQFDQTGSGAAQVNSDWNATSGVAQILNKPSLTNNELLLTEDGNATNVLLSSNNGNLTISYKDSDGNISNSAAFGADGVISFLQPVSGGGIFNGDAANLTGTLTDAQISSNVSLKNINNNFTQRQTITAPSTLGTPDSPVLDLRTIWQSNSGCAGILLNVSDLASPVGSKLLELRTEGTTRFSVDKTGAMAGAGQTITAPANTSALTASYSVTGSNTTPLLNLSGTWSTSGIAQGILLNVTDTASAATSTLIDLRRAGSSIFNVSKFGSVSCFSINTNSSQINCGSVLTGLINSIGWANADCQLFRDAANTLALRNGSSAQTLRCYGSFTDASNGRRLDITSTTAGVFTLTATGNGTGANGNLLKLTAPILLPSSSVTLATNGDLAFEATSNTSLTIRYRGSDGTTRSASLTLA